MSLPLTISLSPQAAQIVQDAVNSGDFPSAEAAVEAAVHGGQARGDGLSGYSPEEIDALIDEGIASGPGREVDFDALKREARRRAGAANAGA